MPRSEKRPKAAKAAGRLRLGGAWGSGPSGRSQRAARRRRRHPGLELQVAVSEAVLAGGRQKPWPAESLWGSSKGFGLSFGFGPCGGSQVRTSMAGPCLPPTAPTRPVLSFDPP